jgi:hypothetical protein
MIMGTATARNPGIVFETSPLLLADPLPRMDIAAFVGFASSGPISLPVAVEGPDEFSSIFGEDVLLGQSTDDGSAVSGQLGRCVRSFFQAGGRRCWIVRAGDDQAAETSSFFLPGVLAATPAAASGPRPIVAAAAVARSPGSWADLLEANATLSQRIVPVLQPTKDSWLRVGDVAAGDLLCLTYRTEPDLLGYVGVPETPSRPGRGPVRPTTLARKGGFWFRKLDARVLAARPAPATLRPLGVSDSAGVPMPPLTVSGWTAEADQVVFDVTGSVPPGVRPGCWIILDLPAGLEPSAWRGLALLAEVERAEDPALIGGSIERWRLASNAIWAELTSSDPPARTIGLTPTVRAMTLELWARSPSNTWRLAELGLAAPHPRFLGNLASDTDLFGPNPIDITPEFRDSITRPRRFPLASGSARTRSSTLFLPLAVEALPSEERYQPPFHSGKLPGVRDGLAEMSADLFLDRDPGVRNATATSLLGEAFWHQYQSGSAEPLPLHGIHALLDVDEISMVAVPDAGSRRWTIQPRVELPFVPPYGLTLQLDDTGGELSWVQPGPAVRVRIDSAADPRFESVSASWVIEPVLTAGPTSFPLDPWTPDPIVRLSWLVLEDTAKVTLTIAGDPSFTEVLEDRQIELSGWPGSAASCPTLRYWRVRAEDSAGRQSPWSDTVWARLPADDFAPCPDDQLLAPLLTVTQNGQVAELDWTSVTGALDYRVEISAEPLFSAARSIYIGTSLHASIWNPGNRISYFRVAAGSGPRLSPWSAVIAIGSVREERRIVESVQDYEMDILVKVHAALIILAAARGDLLAVLGLMQHARAKEIATYRAALLPRISPGSAQPGESDDLDRALSFAALYHPWALVREIGTYTAGSVAAVSPEGFVAGVIAARTLTSGAWAAPANQLLPGVIGLTPEAVLRDLPPSGLSLNLLVSESRGFTLLTEWTLGLAGEVRTIHVRRLLILLRRLALREGSAFAFMANDAVLSRLVQREFEAMLGDLFARGAFAGRVPDEGFQVIADGRINTRTTRDQGRFMVELRVAPSEPLSFLTIRLVQSGGDQLSLQEA